MASPRLAIVIGVVGGFIACGGIELLNYLHVDDPVGVVPVHLFCGIWSLIAAGLFVPEDDMSQGYELYGLINVSFSRFSRYSFENRIHAEYSRNKYFTLYSLLNKLKRSIFLLGLGKMYRFTST